MEIRVLQYFMAVARHENITKATEELHLTQLTEAGLIFKARAQEILSLTEKTKEQFAKMDELVAGDIYIILAAQRRKSRWPAPTTCSTIRSSSSRRAWAVRFASRAWRMP